MTFYLSHFVGFLIQYGTAIAICLMPYHKEAFVFSQKKTLCGFGLMALLFSAFCPPMFRFEARVNIDLLSAFANSYMSIAILLFCVCYFRLIQTETIKKWLVLVLTILYAATHYLIANALCMLFDAEWSLEIYPPFTTMMFAVAAVFLFPVMAVVMRRVIGRYLIEMEVSYIRREFMILLIASLFYLVLLVGCTSLSGYMGTGRWWLVSFAILLVLIMFVLFYCLLFREALWRKKESEQKKYAEIQSLQYSNITREMESFRRTRHDMRHYLGELSELLSQGKTEEMKAYLDELTGLTARPGQVSYCKNEIINSLLQYYTGYASDEGIRLDVHARCEALTIPATDLTVILGNVLENAIRSCEQMEDTVERVIQVQVDTLGDALVMEVTNPCDGVRLSQKYRSGKEFLPAEAYLSIREDGGIGLRSVAHTVERYGGSAKFRFDETEKIFISRIRLNEPAA